MRQLLHRSRDGARTPPPPEVVAVPPVPDSDVGRPDPHKRHVNELIEATVPSTSTAAVAFVCECEAPDCLQVVWLTGDDYAKNRTTRGWTVRAPVHPPA